MRHLLLATIALAAPIAAQRQVEELSIGELQAAMTTGRATSAALTRAYLDRIAKMDRRGPTLRSPGNRP